MSNTGKCANCHGTFPMEALDSKPASLAGPSATIEAISKAADAGEEFDRLECENCYGPAWLTL